MRSRGNGCKIENDVELDCLFYFLQSKSHFQKTLAATPALTGRHRDAIQKGARTASDKGARGTPTFIIGKSTPDGVEGELVVGANLHMRTS